MLELEHNGYYPLSQEHLEMYVPARPGIYMLAVRLVNGVHQSFFTSQSDNLYASLHRLLDKDRREQLPVPQELMDRFQCYFTYFVILQKDYRDELEKMLTHTTDPVIKLKVLNCN